MEDPFRLCTTSDEDRIWKESLKGFSQKAQGELTGIRAGLFKERGQGKSLTVKIPQVQGALCIPPPHPAKSKKTPKPSPESIESDHVYP